MTINAKWANANPIEYLVRLAKYRAKKRGIEFSISVEDLLPAPTVCPVFKTALRYGSGSRSDASASIDRKDNRLGYVSGNVAIMSRRANRIKNDATLEELTALVSFLSGC